MGYAAIATFVHDLMTAGEIVSCLRQDAYADGCRITKRCPAMPGGK
jgi:hypothetical protein